MAVLILEPAWPADHQKKKQAETTQTREVPKDLPNAVTAETQRLAFHVSPLSSKGLLSQQVRDGLRALFRQGSGATIVKLRAFVAGTGDTRRVQTIVSETFTERHMPLPALSVVQAGALPLEGAQVVLESIAVSRKPLNPHGLAFLSGQAASSENPVQPVAPLAEKSISQLRVALRALGLETKDVLRVTCFLSTLEDIGAVRGLVAQEFRQAALNYVQIQREPLRAVAECEAVARLEADSDPPLRFLNPEGLTLSPNYSQIALVSAPRVAFTGTQLAFGYQDPDARLAFQRLEKGLEQVGASFAGAAMSSVYPLSGFATDLVRRIRFEFYDKTRPPASTMLPFEGLPSMDASFAVEVIAALPGTE